METHKSCGFFGTNKMVINESVKDKLKEIIYKLVEDGYRVFYFGGFGEFDDICYHIVSELKLKFTNIHRIFCVADPRWENVSKRPDWLKNEVYEEIIYLPLNFDYWYTRIYYRNCEIINRCDFLIFFAPVNTKSGAYKALKYAKIKNKKYINLATE